MGNVAYKYSEFTSSVVKLKNITIYTKNDLYSLYQAAKKGRWPLQDLIYHWSDPRLPLQPPTIIIDIPKTDEGTGEKIIIPGQPNGGAKFNIDLKSFTPNGGSTIYEMSGIKTFDYGRIEIEEALDFTLWFDLYDVECTNEKLIPHQPLMGLRYEELYSYYEGTYEFEIKEITAPTGYIIDNTPKTLIFDIIDGVIKNIRFNGRTIPGNGGPTIEIDIPNEKDEENKVKLVKIDATTNAPLAEAKFEITRRQRRCGCSCNTNNRG